MNIAPHVMTIVSLSAWIMLGSGYYVEFYKMVNEPPVDHKFELLVAVISTAATVILWIDYLSAPTT